MITSIQARASLQSSRWEGFLQMLGDAQMSLYRPAARSTGEDSYLTHEVRNL